MTTTTIAGIYVGALSVLGPEGQLTGIFKQPIAAARVTTEGITGDHQADRRVHGGPEKALHHYAADNYAMLAARYPAIAALLVPGNLGENLSTRGWTEDNVHVGDEFRIGTARVQVSQPRSPCWKINHRFGVDGLSRQIADTGVVGWYYRVQVPGTIAVGDAFELIGREPDPVSIRAFWTIVTSDRPSAGDLARLQGIVPLNPQWKARLAQRQAWLEDLPEDAAP